MAGATIAAGLSATGLVSASAQAAPHPNAFRGEKWPVALARSLSTAGQATGLFSFGVPSTITVMSYWPQVAISGNGASVAVWLHDADGHWVVETATRQVGESWSSPSSLSAASSSSDQPHVAVSAKGGAVAVWQRYTGTGAVVEAATRSADGNWSSPSILSAAGDSAFAPRVVIDDKGDAVAVWERQTGSGHGVQAATRPADGNWSSPSTLSGDDLSSYQPQVAVSAKGDAVAVWLHSSATGLAVEAAARPAGGGWSQPTTLSARGGESYEPTVAVDDKGDAVAIWDRDVTDTGAVVEAATRPADGKWSSPITISSPEPGSFGPQVAVSAKGEAVAVWLHSTGGHWVVESAARPAGGQWSSPGTVSPAAGDSSEPQVTVDRKGDAVAVWVQAAGTAAVVEVATRPTGGGWSPASPLSASDGHAGAARVAANNKGDAIAAWSRSVSSGSIIEAAVTR